MSLDSIFSDDWSENHRSGVVTIVGKPNVGKSTLINAILGQKIAIATPKPQTTRRSQLGIYTTEDAQILFTDTPGIHKPHNTLGEYMMTMVTHALQDADVIVWLVDGSQAPEKADVDIATTITSLNGNTPILLVINKIDLPTTAQHIDAYTKLIAHEKVLTISASKKSNIDLFLSNLTEMMPLGPRYYPADQVSDLNIRFVVSEMIREKAILHTEQEVPYAIAVDIFDYKDLEERTEIYATIYVERDSQKGIVIGKGGKMIKQIGTEARLEIAELIERPVFLDLNVKVLKDWRSNETFMRRVGYRMPKADEE